MAFLPASGAGALSAACGVGLLATSAWLITRASERPPVLSLCVAIGAVQAFSLGKGIFRYLQRLAVHDMSLDLLGQLRLHLWDVLVPLLPAGFGRRSRGSALSGFVSDAEVVAEGFANATTASIDLTASILLGALLAALVAPVLGALLLVGALAVIALAIGMARPVAQVEHEAAIERAELAGLVAEAVLSAPELIAYGRRDLVAQSLAEVERRERELQRRRAGVTGISRALAIAGTGAVLAGAVKIGLSLNRSGHVGGVMLAVAVFAALAVMDQCAGLPVVLARTSAGAAARRRVRELEALPAPAEELEPGPRPPAAGRWPAHLGGVPAHLGGVPAHLGGVQARLVGVAARAPDGAMLLEDVSFTVGPGERVALVGASGAGKTSAIYTLLHFLACSEGTAHLGPLDVSSVSRSEIASLAGWAPDEAHIFSASLRDNLRLARPSATDGECLASLGRAGLGAWAAALPGGLGAQLGAGGLPLSAGEAQRLALARVLLAGPPLLLLDEPTARLDPATSAALMTELLNATNGRSVLVVSHDMSIADHVDRVITMERGRATAA